MALVPNHARIRIGGTLYGDASWSVGFAVLNKDGSDPFGRIVGSNSLAQLQGWVDAVKVLNDGGVMPGVLLGTIGSRATISMIRAAQVGDSGREQGVAVAAMTGLAGTGGFRNSAQTAVVASLLTQRPGASYRGRIYLPAITPALQTDGRLSTSDCVAISGAVAQWAKQIADALPGSGVSGDPGTHGVFVVSTRQGNATRVTSVRVGNRLDTQRSRAESQEEAYSSALVTQ